MIVDLINLDRFADRRREFMTNNAHLREVRRYSKIDGRELDIQALVENRTIERDIVNTYSAGALAAALAHIALWDNAIQTGEVVTICEDDAIFHHQFEHEAGAIIGRLPADWDVLVYGWNFDSMLLVDLLPGVSPGIVLCDEGQLRAHVEEFQQRSLSPQPIKLLQAFGTMCYSLSPKGAKVLKDFSLPIRPMSIPLPGPGRELRSDRRLSNVGLDVIMSAAYPQLKAFITIPPLVISKNEHANSTMRHLPTLGQETSAGGRSQAPAPLVKPEEINAFNNSGLALHRDRRLDEALAQYEKALSLKPNDVTALSGRGNVLFDLGRYDAAFANCDQLLVQRPNDANALNMRGLILEASKRPEEALASYDKAVPAAPEVIEALYNRGNILADLSRFEEALASYDKALMVAPDAAPILNNRGLVLEELKRFAEALASYEKALRIKPDYGAAANNRRLVLEEIERQRAAAKA
jgi:glycosyl transferase, family 25